MPTLSGSFAFLGVRNLYVAALTLPDDPGGTPAYGTIQAVDGIQDVTLSPVQQNVKNPGNDIIKDVFTKITSLTGDIKHGRLSLPSQAVIEGGTYTASSGTSPNVVVSYDVLGNIISQPFGMIVQAELQDLGDVTFILYKCVALTLPKITAGYGKVNENSFQVEAFPRGADSKLYRIKRHQTMGTISDTTLLTEA